MHEAVKVWVAEKRPKNADFVIEYGSQDMNGSVRDLFDGSNYVGVDIAAGEGVDVVADAAVWVPDDPVDLILCLEVFEHTHKWPQIVFNAYQSLNPGGMFIATAAGPGRLPHSGRKAGPIESDEWYENIPPSWLFWRLTEVGFIDIEVDQYMLDVRCAATKPPF